MRAERRSLAAPQAVAVGHLASRSLMRRMRRHASSAPTGTRPGDARRCPAIHRVPLGLDRPRARWPEGARRLIRRASRATRRRRRACAGCGSCRRSTSLLAHRDRSRIVPSEYLMSASTRRTRQRRTRSRPTGPPLARRVDGTRLKVEPSAPPAKWRREVDAEGERLRLVVRPRIASGRACARRGAPRGRPSPSRSRAGRRAPPLAA